MRRILTLVAAGLCSPALAQPDTIFTYQGELVSGGSRANGPHDMVFRLWNAASGGAPVGNAVALNNVPVSGGLFTVELDFGAAAFDNSGRWLEIGVEGTALAPRQPLTRAPYAIQTRGIFVDGAGRVGLGTTSPANSLDIIGSDAAVLLRTLSNDQGPRLKFRNTAGGSSTVTGRIDFEDPALVASIGYVKPFIGPAGLQFSDASGVRMKITDSGRIGLGTTDPQKDLHLVGEALFSANTQGSALFVDNTTNSPTGSAVTGRTSATAGAGVSGDATSSSGNTFGVTGRSDSTSGTGVRGWAAANSGETVGVEGIAYSGAGRGVYALGFAQGGTNYGLWAESRSPQGRAVYAVNTAASGNTFGVLGQVNSPTGWAGYFSGPAGSWNYFQRNVGIGVVNPSFLLHLGSNSAAKPTSNTWTISSDERLKTDIRPIGGALEDLLRLRGVTYRWRDPDAQGGMAGTYTGMIAQDVEQVFPEWVGVDAEGFKTLTVIGFEGLVVEALRGLRAEKDAQIDALRAENEELRSRFEALERAVAYGP